jgi:hypothetical protein
MFPSLLTCIYGFATTLFQNEKKCLLKSSLFKLFSLFYIGVMGYGVYTIGYDYIVEHHHNPDMMKYMFYHNYLTQFSAAFIYAVIFLLYIRERENEIKLEAKNNKSE